MTQKKTAAKKSKASTSRKGKGATGTDKLAAAWRVLEEAVRSADGGAGVLANSGEAAMCRTLQEDDLLLVYNVRLLDKNGEEVVGNKGFTTLGGLVDGTAKPEVPHIFERLLKDSVWRPLRNRFMNWLQRDLDGEERELDLIGDIGRYDNDEGSSRVPP